MLNVLLRQAIWYERSRVRPGKALALIGRWLTGSEPREARHVPYAYFLQGRILCKRGPADLCRGMRAFDLADRAAADFSPAEQERLALRLALERMYGYLQSDDLAAAEQQAVRFLQLIGQRRKFRCLAMEADAKLVLARIAHEHGDLGKAVELFEMAFKGFRRCHSALGLARLYDSIGQLLEDGEQFGRAERFYLASLGEKRHRGDVVGQAITHGNLGRLCLRRFDLAAASAHFRMDLVLSRRLGDRAREAMMENHLGFAARKQAVLEQAFGGPRAAEAVDRAVRWHERSRGRRIGQVNECFALAGTVLAESVRSDPAAHRHDWRADLAASLDGALLSDKLKEHFTGLQLLADGCQCRRSGNFAEAESYLALACEKLHQMDDQLEAWLELSQVQWQTGQQDRAMQSISMLGRLAQRCRAFEFAEQLAERLRHKGLSLAEPLETMLGYADEPEHTKKLYLTWAHFLQESHAHEEARRSAREARWLADQIEIFERLQRRLLPQKMPAVPGLDVHGRCRQHMGLGGDLFQFASGRAGDAKTLYLTVADAEGKGLPAAPLMAMYCTSWWSHLKHVSSINELARSLCDVMENTGTVKGWAAFLGRIDTRTRMLHYFLAGDVLALLHRERTGRVTMLPADMGAMGWLPFNCAGHREQLAPGDVLVVITDGLWQGMCSLGGDVGPDDWDHHLKDVVSQAVSKADRAEDIADEIMASDFVRASLEAVPDDATIVVVCVDSL